MGQRLQLHQILVNLLGSRNVYFQPDENVKLAYPCIIYQRNDEAVRRADNVRYFHEKRYLVTVIDPNPDSAIPDKVGALPKASFVRFFAKGYLNHDIYNVYF